MTSYSFNKKRGPRELQREGHMKMQAAIGVMLPQAMDHLEQPEPGRDKEGFSPGNFRGYTALILTFCPPELKENTFLLSSFTKFMVICCNSPKKLT